MELSLTREEYGLLLDLLGVAGQILFAHRTEETPALEPYRKLIQKVYALADQAGYGDRVVRDAATGEFRDRELEGGQPMAFIEAYNDVVFWEELAHRLAGRDAAREARGRQLDRDAEAALLARHLARYFDEIAEHGLERLEVVQDGAGRAP